MNKDVKVPRLATSKVAEFAFISRFTWSRMRILIRSGHHYQGRKHKNGVLGVLGHSPLEKLLANLPLTAPFDYMHQVLLGLTRSFLFLAVQKIAKK